jgi:hypothetical protein
MKLNYTIDNCNSLRHELQVRGERKMRTHLDTQLENDLWLNLYLRMDRELDDKLAGTIVRKMYVKYYET